MALRSRGPQSSADLVRSSCCGGSNGESCEATEATAPATAEAATTTTTTTAVMSPLRSLELAAICALAILASVTARELDYEVFSIVFGVAAAVAAFESARSR
jgi:hypothetical protein